MCTNGDNGQRGRCYKGMQAGDEKLIHKKQWPYSTQAVKSWAGSGNEVRSMYIVSTSDSQIWLLWF